MDQSYELEINELFQAEQLGSQHKELLARYGACTLELEQIRTLLPQVQEKQKELINRVAASRGVTQYVSARIIGRNLVCQTPDAPPYINGAGHTSDPTT
jgi:hypothetical protein